MNQRDKIFADIKKAHRAKYDLKLLRKQSICYLFVCDLSVGSAGHCY